MKQVILVRHAQSTANLQREIVSGRSNGVLLSEDGMAQPTEAAAFLQSREVAFDSWYSSPAVRAIATGRLLVEALGLQLEPVVEDDLQELSQGSKEGKLRDEVYTPEVRALIEQELKDFRFEGGESMNDVGGRMHSWLQKWQQSVPKGHTSLVTTHGFSIRCLAGYLQDWSHAEIRAAHVENCSATTLIYNQGWTIESYAEDTLALNTSLREFKVDVGTRKGSLQPQQPAAQEQQR